MTQPQIERIRDIIKWVEANAKTCDEVVEGYEREEGNPLRIEWWSGASFGFNDTANYLRSLLPEGK